MAAADPGQARAASAHADGASGPDVYAELSDDGVILASGSFFKPRIASLN